MIAICEECGKKYRIDPLKIKGNTASFHCRVCNHRVTVSKPASRPQAPQMDLPVSGEKPEPTPVTTAREPESKQQPAKKSESYGTTPKKNRFGLTEKMISLMLFVTLVPLIVFWGISFRQTSERIRNDSQKLLIQSSERLGSHINEWMDKNIRLLKTCADLPAVTAMDSQGQEPVLRAMVKNYPWIRLAFTLSAQGIQTARSDGQPLEDHTGRQYVRDIIGGSDTAWQASDEKPPKKPVLVLAVPVKDGKRLIGMLGCALPIDEISGEIINRIQGQTGFGFLTDAKGTVIAHQIPQLAQKGKNVRSHPLIAAYTRGQKGLISFEDDNGTLFLGNVRPTVFGWLLAFQAEQKEVFKVLKVAQFFAYIYLGITMIVVVCIAFVAGKMMTRPIRELTDAADRISVGELDVEIGIRRKDEIGDLAEAVLRMQDSLRLSIERLRRRR